MNKKLIILLMVISLILGIFEGYYLHESVTDYEIRIEANRLIKENNIKLIYNESQISNITLCDKVTYESNT